MENNKFYQLNCPHCGQFINLNAPSSNTNTNTDTQVIYSDEKLGNIYLSNHYKNSGSFGGYEAVDVEMICPHCSYMFKSTCHYNYSL